MLLIALLFWRAQKDKFFIKYVQLLRSRFVERKKKKAGEPQMHLRQSVDHPRTLSAVHINTIAQVVHAINVSAQHTRE